ncbi:MAG: bacteriohemerythrin [Candidatus Thiodiazotropha sp.]|jgi:hemerythrin-like metal-binding protein
MKPFLIWRDDWLLGFEHLDEQHLELVDALNNLHRFFLQVKEKRVCAGMNTICRQLSVLRDLTHHHFQTEEALMQRFGFPGLADHHREHVMLLAELQLHIREIEAGSKPFTLGTLTALKHWQIDHLLYSDRKFADYLMCQLPSSKVFGFKDKTGKQSSQQILYSDSGDDWRKNHSG